MKTVSAASLAACLTGATLVLACGPPEGGPSPDTGAFVIRLGTDTVAVERYTLAADSLQATTVTRSPRTRVQEIALALLPGGAVRSFERTVRDPGAPADAPPIERTVMTYGPDSITVEMTEEGETETRSLPAGPNPIPRTLVHFSLEELVIRRSLVTDRDTIYRPGEPPIPVAVRRTGADSIALETSNLGTWRARVDERGRILEMHAGALGRTIERVPELDLAATAERWAAQDARGEGMGPLSPRDTMTATVHGARITIDYSRPARRGRQVFGGLVPWNEVWRTGANRATHLITDRALTLGETRVPAGTYTLFTIPRQDGWTLIINRQTEQGGTDYDESQDLARLPMNVESLDQPVERFTIRVQERSDSGGVLELVWAGTRAWIPFTIGP